MYKQYLVDYKKLIYLVGQEQDTQYVKNLLQNIPEKFNINWVCSKETNFDYKKKYFGSSKNESYFGDTGILKSYWLSKILQKDPMVVILIFNYSKPLQTMQKWEDRLYNANATINKTREFLRMQNKKNINLLILILINQSVIGGVSIIDKSKQYLKINDRSLQIINYDFLKNDIKRLRMLWLNYWDKLFQDRLKRRQKKLQEATKQQLKLHSQIKLSVMHDIIGKQNYMTTYQNTYFLCKKIFISLDRRTNQQLQMNLNLFELRAIADFLILKIFKLISKTKVNDAFDRLVIHFSEFKNKSFPQLKNKYFYYEQIQWRINYLSTVIQSVLFPPLNIGDKEKLKVTQYINGILNYRLELASLKDTVQQNRILVKQDQVFFGKFSYKIAENQKFQYVQDTRIYQIMQNRSDHIEKGITLIINGKILLKKYQEMYLNLVLLRFYLLSNNIQLVLKLYNEIVEFYYTKGEYFVLNYLLKEIQNSLEVTKERSDMLKFNLMAIKISDYFNNSDRLSEFSRNVQSIICNNVFQTPVTHYLKSYSFMGRILVDYSNQSVLLSQKMKIRMEFNNHKAFENLFSNMDIVFNNEKIQYKNIKLLPQMQIDFQPSDFITQQQTLEIKQIILKNPNLHNLQCVITKDQISYKKHRKLFIVMPLKDPSIVTNQKYKKVYVNQITPVEFQVINHNTDSRAEAKLYFGQEQGQNVEVFRNLQDKINLTNTMTSSRLDNSSPNMFYFKCGILGEKRIKISCNIVIERIFKNSKGEEKILRRQKKLTEQIKFTVLNLFAIKKKFKAPHSEIINKRIKFDNQMFQLPANQKLFLHLQLKPQQNIIITKLNQQQINDDITFIKSLRLSNITLDRNVEFKAITVIKINQQGNQTLKLPPYVVHWKRNEPNSNSIQNIYMDAEQKIRIINKSISFQLKEIEPMRKDTPSLIHYRLMNYNSLKVRLRIFILQNDQFMLLGKNRYELLVNQNTTMIISVKLIPLVTGQFSMPQIVIRALDQNSQYRMRKKQVAFVNC